MSNIWLKYFWPLSSSDLNPLDFFWRGKIEKRTNATFNTNAMLVYLKLLYPESKKITQSGRKENVYLFRGRILKSHVKTQKNDSVILLSL